MRRKGRLIVLAMLAFLPLAISRRLYRWFFGYRIGRRVRLGIVLLDCQSLSIGEGTILGHGTFFWRCGKVSIGEEARIGPLNLFRGGESIFLGNYVTILRLNVINAIPDHDLTNDPASVFELGDGSVLTAEHRIDFTDLDWEQDHPGREKLFALDAQPPDRGAGDDWGLVLPWLGDPHCAGRGCP
jgi:hypothetical protein